MMFELEKRRLILVHQDFYLETRRRVIAGVPGQRQQQYNQCFENLMAEVTPTLSTKNRDKFTQNLAVFRRDLNQYSKPGGASGGGSASESGMSVTSTGFTVTGGGSAANVGGGSSRSFFNPKPPTQSPQIGSGGGAIQAGALWNF